MRKLIIVIILSVLIITVSALGVVTTKHYSDSLNESINKAITCADNDDYDGAVKNIEELAEKWENAETVLCFYKGQYAITEISKQIEYIYKLAERKDDEFSPQATVCYMMIFNLYHDERVSHQLLF